MKLLELNNIWCVYKFYIEDELAYIGKTTNLSQRLRVHFNKKTVMEEPWKNHITKMNYYEIKSKNAADLSFLELYLILKNKPRYNKEYNSCKKVLTYNIPLPNNKIIDNDIWKALKYKLCNGKSYDEIIYKNKVNWLKFLEDLELYISKNIHALEINIRKLVFDKVKCEGTGRGALNKYRNKFKEIGEKYGYTLIWKALNNKLIKIIEKDPNQLSLFDVPPKSEKVKIVKESENIYITNIQNLQQFESVISHTFIEISKKSSTTKTKTSQFMQQYSISRYKLKKFIAETSLDISIKGHYIYINNN